MVLNQKEEHLGKQNNVFIIYRVIARIKKWCPKYSVQMSYSKYCLLFLYSVTFVFSLLSRYPSPPGSFHLKSEKSVLLSGELGMGDLGLLAKETDDVM